MSTCLHFQQTRNALVVLEERFKCHKCGSFASSPVTLGGCEHIFCRICCEDYLGTACPVCGIATDVRDAGVDRQLFHLASLCVRMKDELMVDKINADNYKENEDPQIQCTPNQPVPLSHDSRALERDDIADPINSSASKKPTSNKKVVSASIRTMSSIKNGKQSRKEKVKHERIVAKFSEPGKRFRERKSLGRNSPSKRRKSLQQSTITQFYTPGESADGRICDSHIQNPRASKKATKNECNLAKSQKSSGKVVLTLKTRLRHSVGSNMGKFVEELGTPEQVDIIVKMKANVGNRRGKKDKAEQSPRNTLACARSVDVPTLNSGTGKQAPNTQKGRQSAKYARGIQSSPLNKRNAKGETPLQVAAIKNDVVRVKQLLAEAANPNVRDNAGWTPLHEACNHGYLEIATLLLDHGAMINIPGHENDTPLHDAINNVRLDCVSLLVSRGASLNLRNLHGQTARDLAVTESMKEALKTPVVTTANSTALECIDVLEYQIPCLLGTGLSREEKVTLQKAASQLHVKLVEDVTAEVTHIVTKFNAEGMCPRTIKIVQGILLGKWILSLEWLETCIQVGSLVCEEAFEAQGTSLFPHAKAPTKGRMNRKQQLPGLFDGCHFYFYGSFEYAIPSKEDFMNIVSVAGAKILSREPKPGQLDMTITVPYHAVANSQLARCCVFLVHEGTVQFKPIRTKHMCSVPASWLMDCASNFTLMPLPSAN